MVAPAHELPQYLNKFEGTLFDWEGATTAVAAHHSKGTSFDWEGATTAVAALHSGIKQTMWATLRFICAIGAIARRHGQKHFGC